MYGKPVGLVIICQTQVDLQQNKYFFPMVDPKFPAGQQVSLNIFSPKTLSVLSVLDLGSVSIVYLYENTSCGIVLVVGSDISNVCSSVNGHNHRFVHGLNFAKFGVDLRKNGRTFH